ncbi:AraC family transcriptional regulator [Winogradskyella sp.]|uniref:helix-turn-helix domain-containing protein n=1 Tax=Winogradskyella sp. TaxID=1883156 RepID=UPI0026218A51|nr:AraC family transcriptional regulator [Winogradskyella sp.]
MLRTIQIIALLQGVFLLIVLFQRKREYKKVNFWLLLGCILSVILYAIGDDDYNLFVNNVDWFLFHDTLIITFFFLFVRYYKSGKSEFNNKDLWFFVPYVVTVIYQTIDIYYTIEKGLIFKIAHVITELSFLAMLGYAIHNIITKKKEKWLLVFIIPLTIIFTIDELAFLITNSTESPYFLDSYGTIIAAVFLFYYVLYKLIIAPKEVLPKSNDSKYKTSSLNGNNIDNYKAHLFRLMEEEKLFKNNKITVNDVAEKMNIPRQHLSEILNVHLKIGFQDLLNQYRVEEFIECLKNETYKNYTLLGIANEVGFSSKSSFNTTFKKLTGVTPSAYKKQLI